MAGVNSKVLQAALPSGTHKFALSRRLDKLFEDHDMPEEFKLKINDSGKSIVIALLRDYSVVSSSKKYKKRAVVTQESVSSTTTNSTSSRLSFSRNDLIRLACNLQNVVLVCLPPTTVSVNCEIEPVVAQEDPSNTSNTKLVLSRSHVTHTCDMQNIVLNFPADVSADMSPAEDECAVSQEESTEVAGRFQFVPSRK